MKIFHIQFLGPNSITLGLPDGTECHCESWLHVPNFCSPEFSIASLEAKEGGIIAITEQERQPDNVLHIETKDGITIAFSCQGVTAKKKSRNKLVFRARNNKVICTLTSEHSPITKIILPKPPTRPDFDPDTDRNLIA
jgi:hypothetical protein